MTETEFEPVRIRSDAPVDSERVVLFYIDEKAYDIPKVVPPNTTIRYMRDVIYEGSEYALAIAMEEVLGAEAMEALAECKTISEDQVKEIMNLVERMLLASSEKSTGKSRKERRR